jgi:signal transduction histidine kinase/FixJ family two-component response regulator
MINFKNKIDNLLSKFIKLPDNKNKELEESCGFLPQDENIGDININLYLKMFIHELRTPLSTINMGLDILKNNIDNEENKNIITDLKQSVDFMENIFSKFAVIQDGNIELNNFEPFSIVKLLKSTKKLLHYNIDDNKVDFTYNIESAVYDWNYGDKHNIKHCIINLLKNSIKYKNKTRKSVVTINVTRLENFNFDLHNSIRSNNSQEKSIKRHRAVKSMNNFKSSIEPKPPLEIMPSRKSLSTKSNESVNKQYISISICDNNDNILPHIKEHLFESFNSTSGSGLGLYICKNIIELHKGNIDHSFISPNGNKFTIILPLEMCQNKFLQISDSKIKEKDNSNDSTQSKDSKQEKDNSKDNNKDNSKDTSKDNSKDNSKNNSKDNSNINSKKEKDKYNILLVDDSLLNRKMAHKLITSVKYYNKVSELEDSTIVLNKINDLSSNIIFLDKNMPNKNGDRVAKELRENNYDQLIIGLTGEYDKNEIENFLECGANYVIIKPFDLDKLKLITDFVKKYGTKQQIDKQIKLNNNCLEWI